MIHDFLCAARDVPRRRPGQSPGGEELVEVTSPGRGTTGQGDSIHVEPYFFPLEQQWQTRNPFMDDSIPFMFHRLRSPRFRTAGVMAPEVRGVEPLAGGRADRS